jgi:probable F420-dependent oxidoreductase
MKGESVKIGVTFPQNEFSGDAGAIKEFAQTIEGLGFSSFLAYDHVLSADASSRPGFSGAYDLTDPFHEIFVLFGFVAAITERVELVSGVLILPQRQTALVAKQAAEVDILSNGRLRLGIGVGWNEVEFEGLGMDFSTRGARSEEQIHLLRRLWTEDTLSFEGRWDRIDRAGIVPLPVQRPIPIWIGGYVEAARERAGRLADGYFPRGDVKPDANGRAMFERLRGYAAEAGRDPGSIGIHMQFPVGSGSPDEWRARRNAWKEVGVTDLSVNTMRAGFTTPAQHLAAIERAASVLLEP